MVDEFKESFRNYGEKLKDIAKELGDEYNE